jgi:glycosyltransferase involved in cell wall biosynthesis
MFSIIIPTYNRKLFLKKAIDSVLDQTFSDFELIVVDDGSTDGTTDLILSYKDSRLKYFYKENGGPSSARNLAIKNSTQEYICPLDSDDWWDKNKLLIQVEYLESHPEYKIFHTQEVWYRNGKILNQRKKHKKPSGQIFPHCLPLCCVSISTAVIHMSVFSKIGLFDETLPACEDYDFWLRTSLKYPVFLIDLPLTLKDGGRPDQLSLKTEGLDKYRILALEKFLKSTLTKDQKNLILAELIHKIKIYLNGCIKRNKLSEIKEYTNLLLKYETDPVSC